MTDITHYTDGAVELDGETIIRAWKFQRGEHGRKIAVRGTVTPQGGITAEAGSPEVDITDVYGQPEARPGGRPTLNERLLSLYAPEANNGVPLTVVVDGETVSGTLSPRTGSVWGCTLRVLAGGEQWEVPAEIVCDDGPTRLATPTDWQTEVDWEVGYTLGQSIAIVGWVEAVEALEGLGPDPR